MKTRIKITALQYTNRKQTWIWSSRLKYS